jgi:EamA-like transporter family
LTSLSSLTFLTPVFALLFGNLFLSEMLSPLQWMGVSLTLVSIYLVNQRDVLAQRLQGQTEVTKLPTSVQEPSSLTAVSVRVIEDSKKIWP